MPHSNRVALDKVVESSFSGCEHGPGAPQKKHEGAVSSWAVVHASALLGVDQGVRLGYEMIYERVLDETVVLAAWSTFG